MNCFKNLNDFKPVSPPPLEFFSFCWLGVKWFVRFILRAWLKNGTNNNFKEMINQITKPMKLGFSKSLSLVYFSK